MQFTASNLWSMRVPSEKGPPQTGLDTDYPGVGMRTTPSFRYGLEYTVIVVVSQQRPLLLDLDDDVGASASDVATPNGPSSRSTHAQR